MEVLGFFEQIRTPLLNEIFLTITRLGEEYVFLLVALLFIWCIDKKVGYIILISGLLGQLTNQFLKISFKIERPWVRYSELMPVESAIPAASGYSFPSGHTQIAATTFGTVGFAYKDRKSISLSAFVIVLLVGISRIYLGVHYLSDVLFSLIFGILISYLINKSFSEVKYTFFRVISIVMSIALLIYVFFATKGEWGNEFAYSAVTHSAKFFGATLAFVISWIIDEKRIKFETSGKLCFQLFKLIVGVGLVIFIKSGLKVLFLHIGFNQILADGLRYFLIVFFAGTIWPLLFTKFHQNLSKIDTIR